MKPYNELTRLGRLRRLRKLAEAALEEYGLAGANLTFTHSEGNVIFRVDVPGPTPDQKWDDPYVPNRYNLRILATSQIKDVLGELTWLAALRQEADLPVPEPVSTLNGELLTRITSPEVPDGKLVSLMRWVDGRHLNKGLQTHHSNAWGELVGQLHKFSAGWQPPEGFERPTWDWDGQLSNGVLRTPVDELAASMPEQFREPFEIVSREVRDVMASFGKGADAYGLIHCDMYLENLLFKAGQPRLIDFEDCGYGYWMWDFGVIFSQWPWTIEFPRLRDAFFDGYSQIRTLPETQYKHLDLFMAAQCATMVLWSSMFIKNDPALRSEYEAWRTKEGNKLLRYFERG
jgi:Ser/Thr protein kinase RdoA (MazF antagonist)